MVLLYIKKRLMSITNLGYIPHDISQIYIQFYYHNKKVVAMRIKEAVAQRIMNLCKEHDIAINALGNISGVNPSTIYSMLNSKSQIPALYPCKNFAMGLKLQ